MHVIVRLIKVAVWMVGCCLPLSVQAGLDSLMTLLPRVEDSARVEVLNQIGYENWIIAPEASIQYGKEALYLADSLGFAPGKAFALRVIGVAHWAIGNYQPALRYLLQGQQAYRALDDSLGLANCLMNMGLVYKDQQDNQRALSHFNRAITLFNELDQQSRIATTYTKVGTVYLTMGRYQEALDYLEQALEIHQENDFTYGIAEAQNRLGRLYEQQGEVDKGLTYLRLALENGRLIQDREGEVSNLQQIGRILLGQGKLERARAYLLDGESVAKEIGSKKRLLDIYRDLKDLSLRQGNTTEGLAYYDLYSSMKDTLFSSEKALQIANLQAEITTAEQAQAIQAQKQAIKLLEEKNRFNSLLTGSLGVVLVVLLALAWVMISNQRRRLQQNQALHQSKQALQAAELENERLKALELRQSLDSKNRELTAFTLNFIRRQEHLDALKTNLRELPDASPETIRKKLSQLIRQIEMTTKSDQDWEDFSLYFEQVHPRFFQLLKSRHPELSNSEQKLAALLRLNLNIKQAAAILGISPESVKTARYRLRRKLKLERDANLVDYMQGLARAEAPETKEAADAAS